MVLLIAGCLLKTHDFLKPLERSGKGHRDEAASGDLAVACVGPAEVGRAASVEHVLPGGIGTYSITHVSDPSPLAMVKPELGTCRGVAVERKPDTYYANGVTFAPRHAAGVPFALWDEAGAKDRVSTGKIPSDGADRSSRVVFGFVWKGMPLPLCLTGFRAMKIKNIVMTILYCGDNERHDE